MKKLIISSVFAISSMAGLVGCGNSAGNAETDGNVVNHYIVDGKEMTEDEYKQYLSDQEEKTESVNESSDKTSVKQTTGEKTVNITPGQTYSATDGTNDLEITLDSVGFEQEVHSLVEDTNQYSKYFSDVEGETYIVMKLNIKNVGGDSISNYVFNGSYENERNKINVTFNEKFNYEMQQLDTESIVMSQFWSLQPLKEQKVYFVQSVPDEVVSMPYEISFRVGDDGTTYVYSSK